MIRRLLVNSGSNILVMLVKLAVTFVMTPIFITNLGKYDYGLWEMIVGVIGYMGMLDLGIRPAISRYAAKYSAEKDQHSLMTVYSSTFFFMVAVGFCLLVFFVLWGIWFPHALAPEGDSAQRYSLLLLILGARLLFIFPGFVAESYLEGFQKYYLKNNITIFNTVVSAVIIYLFINPGNALLLVAAVSSIGLLLKYILFFVLLARPVYGALRVQLKYFSWSRLKEIVRFGLKSFVQGVATRVETSSDIMIIGFVLGPAVVPFYSVPANLVQYLRTIGWTITHAFLPLFSDMSVTATRDSIVDVYLRASKYVIAIMLPMAVGILLIGGPFLSIWIGAEFGERGEQVIAFIVVFVALPFINPFYSRYLTAIDKHGIFARLTPIAALINIGLSLLLVKPFGIKGVAAASVVSVVIFVPIYLRYCCRQLGVPVGRYLKNSLLPSLVPVLVLALVVSLIRYYHGLNSYADIIGTVVVAGLVWIPLSWYLTFDSVERHFIVERFRGALGKS